MADKTKALRFLERMDEIVRDGYVDKGFGISLTIMTKVIREQMEALEYIYERRGHNEITVPLFEKELLKRTLDSTIAQLASLEDE